MERGKEKKRIANQADQLWARVDSVTTQSSQHPLLSSRPQGQHPGVFGHPGICWAWVTSLILFKSGVLNWTLLNASLTTWYLGWATGKGEERINDYCEFHIIARFAEDNHYRAHSVWKYCLNLLSTCCLQWKTKRQKALLVSGLGFRWPDEWPFSWTQCICAK